MIILKKTNATEEIKNHMLNVFARDNVDLVLLKWRQCAYFYEFLNTEDLKFNDYVGNTHLLLSLLRIKRWCDEMVYDHKKVLSVEVNITADSFVLKHYELGEDVTNYHMFTPYFEYDRKSTVTTEELKAHYEAMSGDTSMTSNMFTRNIKKYFPDCVRARLTDAKRTRGFKGIRIISAPSAENTGADNE